jgi:hypothetical protein
MKHFQDEWIQDWCNDNGWTDLFVERCHNYWAFPPGAVIPEPIPSKVLRSIKLTQGLSQDEKTWLRLAAGFTVLSLILGFLLWCPMPVVFAFAFDAITAAQLEVEYI